ncbi:nSTAND1 domain-containing NTPase [Spirosoma gilvum]
MEATNGDIMVDAYNKVNYTNPFPGLRSFEREDAYLFFGRDNQIRELKGKLADSRFLAIIGSSGSGKSSLVKAGLVPLLVNKTLPDAEEWLISYFNPEATPILNVARALHQTLSERNRMFASRFSVESVETLLVNNPQELMTWCQGANLLFIIDQFEELFRYQQLENKPEQVTQFINLLLELTRWQTYPVYAVLTMRSDYLDKCTDYEGLTEAINHGSYLLPKMNREEIRQAIVTPINVMGASISEDLTVQLLDDLGARTDQLPILQHALMRTWNHWQQNRKMSIPIGMNDYRAIGGMSKAITIHAEEVFQSLPDEKSQRATERLFKALLVLNEGNEGVIMPAPVKTFSELSGVPLYLLIDVLNKFRDPEVAFLTPPTSIQASPDLIVDISHERILHLWERLEGWMNEEVESAKFYRQLSTSATLYHEGKTGLWVNPELQIGLKWLADHRPTQAWANRYDPYLERAINFLEYSRNQYEFEIQNKEDRQRNELRRTRFFALFLGASAGVSLLFLLISAVLRTQAQQSATEALNEKKQALIQSSRAEEQTREAITQKKIAEQQEIIAEQQKRLTDEQRLIALREKKNADDQRIIAVDAQHNAEEQQRLAVAAQKNAEQQRTVAEGAQKNAEIQKNLAQAAQTVAETQKHAAEVAQKYAEQQRGKAVARTLAIQSFQMTDNGQDDLHALLALEAYRLNLKNGGQSDNPDIFNALSKATNVQNAMRRHTDIVRSIALQEDLVASGSDDGTVKLWPYDNPSQTVRSLGIPTREPDGIRAILFVNDGKQLIGASEKGMLYRWNVSQADLPFQVKAHKNPVLSLQLIPGSSNLVSVTGSGAIRTWRSTATGIDSLQHVQVNFPFYSSRLTPDGKYLYCGSRNGQIVRFAMADLKQKPEVISRAEFGNRVTALAFSPDGSRLVTGNAAGLVYSWKLSGGEPETSGTQLSGRHQSTVNDIAFTPNGKLLATCSSDWSIHIWDYSALSPQLQPIVINDFDSWVMAIRFTSDGRRLAACGADKTVRIRNVDTDDLYAELSRKVKRSLTLDEWTKYIGKDIPYEPFKP